MHVRPLQLIPQWRGDETLYSWAARMHRIVGYSVKDTGRLLFGASHAYKEWATSTRFAHFGIATNKHLGNTKDILLQRTVLAAYYPFLRYEQREEFDRCAESNVRTPWLTRFGMRASTLDKVEMRWCQCCIQNDLADGAMPRWRLPHQLPGAWWCVEHDLYLNKLNPDIAEWVIPLITNPTSQPLLNNECIQALRNLSALAGSLVGKERVNLVGIKRAVLSRLRDMGLVTSIKPVSSEILQQWFALTRLAEAVKQVEPSIQSVIEKQWIYETLLKRRASHPLLWMMLWVATFEGFSTQDVVRGFHEPDAMLIWQDDGQGQLWIEKEFQADEKVQAIVKNAKTIKSAAQQLKVSVATIRRYMKEAQCSPQHVRGTNLRQNRKVAALAEIEALINETHDVTKTDVHLRCKGSVSWLKRWEPELLASTLAKIPEIRDRQCVLPLFNA